MDDLVGKLIDAYAVCVGTWVDAEGRTGKVYDVYALGLPCSFTRLYI